MSSLPLLCIGSLCVALSRNATELVIGRAIQAFGASSIMSVGAATISDIYKLEERGTAMGMFFGVSIVNYLQRHVLYLKSNLAGCSSRSSSCATRWRSRSNICVVAYYAGHTVRDGLDGFDLRGHPPS